MEDLFGSIFATYQPTRADTQALVNIMVMTRAPWLHLMYTMNHARAEPKKGVATIEPNLDIITMDLHISKL